MLRTKCRSRRTATACSSSPVATISRYLQQVSNVSINILQGSALIWSQFKAMLFKRTVQSIRNKRAIFAQIVLPMVVICRHDLVCDCLAALCDGRAAGRQVWADNWRTAASGAAA